MGLLTVLQARIREDGAGILLQDADPERRAERRVTKVFEGNTCTEAQ